MNADPGYDVGPRQFWNIKLAPSPKKAISSPEIGESKTDSALDSKAGEISSAVAPPEGQTANEETESEWVLQEKRETPSSLKEKQKIMEEQVYRIWTVLSTFEESSAACISEMLRHVSNGHYIDGVRMAEKFVLHVEVLFSAIDELGVHFRSASAKGARVSAISRPSLASVVSETDAMVSFL